MDIGARPKNILERIVEARRESVAHRKRVLPEAALRTAVEKRVAPPRDFPSALTGTGVHIIAELKRASPSRGVIRSDFAPALLAADLEQSGAAALSVLTEESFFSGSLADLKEASRAAKIPILRKDFIMDPWQVWETRAGGADSFLLIAAVLDDETFRTLLALGRSLKMEPFVEVHTREELKRVLSFGAQIIGVNNRDLQDFSVHLKTSFDLVQEIPEDCIAVSESGLRAREDLVRLREAGFDAFLIGESLMQQDHPGDALRNLLRPIAVENHEQSSDETPW
jgi:indole-3-glycerol phosphate synthase